MSGHSRWANIKHRKGISDKRKNKAFTKILKEITVASKLGGEDLDANPRLRSAVITARGLNIPKDTIARSVGKGSDKNTADFQELVYEGSLAGGIAIIIEVATDNANRTIQNLRTYFTKKGGSIGVTGSVTYLFERKCIFQIENSKDFWTDDFTFRLIDIGADEVEAEDENVFITAPIQFFGLIQSELEKISAQIERSELAFLCLNPIEVNEVLLDKLKSLLEQIEDDDDVQKVFHNVVLEDYGFD